MILRHNNFRNAFQPIYWARYTKASENREQNNPFQEVDEKASDVELSLSKQFSQLIKEKKYDEVRIEWEKTVTQFPHVSKNFILNTQVLQSLRNNYKEARKFYDSMLKEERKGTFKVSLRAQNMMLFIMCHNSEFEDAYQFFLKLSVLPSSEHSQIVLFTIINSFAKSKVEKYVKIAMDLIRTHRTNLSWRTYKIAFNLFNEYPKYMV